MSANDSNPAGENPRPLELDTLPARPIRTRLLRELLSAPQLERYLDVGKIVTPEAGDSALVTVAHLALAVRSPRANPPPARPPTLIHQP